VRPGGGEETASTHRHRCQEYHNRHISNSLFRIEVRRFVPQNYHNSPGRCRGGPEPREQSGSNVYISIN
jgi:hypothetical protein